MEPNINKDNESSGKLTKNGKPYVFHYNSSLDYASNSENDDLQYDNFVQKTSNKAGYKALYLSLVIVGVFLLCFIMSGGSTSEADDGAVWWLVIIYCWMAELPIMIASIIFGIKGLKDENKLPSYASFVINLIKIALFAIIMFRN